MSDANKVGFDPIPLGLPARSSDLLLPPPKPTMPVEPRPMPPALPRLAEPEPEIKVETPKPAIPGRLAWVPEALGALVRPSRQKGVLAAGLASLAAGAAVASFFWPVPPAATVTPAKSEPTVSETPPTATIELPKPKEPEPEPLKLAPPSVSVQVTPPDLPPLSTTLPKLDGEVKLTGGSDEKKEPVKSAPEANAPVLPLIPPKQEPALPVPAIDTKTPLKLDLPELSIPSTPAIVVPDSKPALPLPEVKSSAPAITLPEVKPSTVPSIPEIKPSLPPVVPEVKALNAPSMPEIKPSLPDMNPTVPPVTLPEIKTAIPAATPLPEVRQTPPPAPVPDAKELQFVPTGTAKKPEPETTRPPVLEEPRPLPKSEPVKPASGVSPREDYDVDVHYPAAGDSWSGISKHHLGDERYAEALRAYNGNRGLVPGQPVDIPPIHVLRKQYSNLITATRRLEPAAAETLVETSGRVYEVPAGGMTIKEIARKTLGDENLWGQIWELNPKLRADETVVSGTKVKLPRDARTGE